jgi:cytochrome c biogenesis protein ResB
MLLWRFLITIEEGRAERVFVWLALCTELSYNAQAMRIIHKFLVSLKSAIVILVILTLLAMLGTLVPQNLAAVDYLRMYPRAGHLLLSLGFDDMYRSAPFQTCLWLLSLSTLACILTRWKSTWRKLSARIERASVKEIKAYEAGLTLTEPLLPDWEKHFGKSRVDENGVRLALHTSGQVSLFGGMFIHIGLLLVFAGGLLGLNLGVETVIRGAKGDKVPVPPLAAVRAARDADRIAAAARNIRAFSPEDQRLDKMRKEIEVLHEKYKAGLASPAFRIKFEELWVENYQASDGHTAGVKSWNSRVRFIESEKIGEPVVIKVNHPVSYGDYTFYQSSWNKHFKRVKVRVDVAGATATADIDTRAFPVILELGLKEPIKPEWAPFELVLVDFMPDFRIINERFVSVSQELNNPAAMIVAYDSSGNVAGRAWAFPEDRMAMAGHVTSMPLRFTFLEAEAQYESGMQMTYDPGKSVVWLGCILFTLGLIMSFYVTYREEWLLIYPDGNCHLAITGNRPPGIFADDLSRLTNQLTVTSKESATS